MDRRTFLGTSATVLWFSAAGAASSLSAYSDAALRDHSGRKTSLAAVASGKRLVVVVMKGSWCPVCVAQIRRLESMRSRLNAVGALLVAVSTDSTEDNRRAATRERLSTVLLSDP